MNDPFRWVTPLGVSVILFIVIGALWLFVGILTVPLHKRAAPAYLFISPATDAAFYGASSLASDQTMANATIPPMSMPIYGGGDCPAMQVVCQPEG